MNDFAGKVAVVTGAASGIGLALAQRFAREGMRLVLADTDAGGAGRAARNIGAPAIAVRADVAVSGDLEALASRAYDAFGAVHILCNNAGIGGPFAPCWELAAADWERVLGVNLWGVIHGIRAFVPRMLASGEEGHVVNTASMAGLLSMPHGAAYHASKHAVVTLTESLYHDLILAGSRVSASVLCPAFVRTAIVEAEIRRASSAGAPALKPDLQAQLEEGYLRAVSAGLDPSEVADQVLEAIRTRKLYVLTHPHYASAVMARAEQIVSGTNPDTASTLRRVVRS
ncbi:MAG: SDR family NAD(P)-dependent oxidoreductase [Bryobacteraceae bacterium]|nr:SDR family NAD(P)-dependent oxidoreductase [Bryobacteraceae bacterium]